MSSAIAFSLLRRTPRLPIFSSPFSRRPGALFHSSSSLTQTLFLTRSLAKFSSRTPLRSASSKAGKADLNLKRVLDSEIDAATQQQSQEVDLPDGFPFEIIDNLGDQTITLKRKNGWESIQATVFMNIDEVAAEDDVDNVDCVQPSLSLVVMIDKGKGPALEFCCSLNADELSIESMAMKNRDDPDDQSAYQGPEFFDLDESLQKALHEYLEARGIESSLFDFLQEYMASKEEREYLAWLKKTSKFLEI